MSAQITIEGDLDLHLAAEDRETIEADLSPNSIYGDQPADTLLVGLVQQKSYEYSGVAVGTHLMTLDEFSDDPLAALAEWVAKFESYVNGNQGDGWEVDDQAQGRTYNGVIEAASWRRRAGEKYQVDWNLSILHAEATMERRQPAPESVSPSSSGTIAGKDMGQVRSIQVERKQQIKRYPLADGSTGEDPALSGSGAIRTVTLSGQQLQKSSKDFEETINQSMGTNTIVTYESPFPGRTLEGMIQDFDMVQDPEDPRLDDYRLKFIEGAKA